VNAEQVKALLGSNVRLNDVGEVEVVDSKGSVRYTDKGEPLAVEDLVREFLDSNPHFRTANPSTTNTRSNTQGRGTGPLDITKLNMNDAKDRALYKEYRKSQGLS
jgi:hypothetical protein